AAQHTIGMIRDAQARMSKDGAGRNNYTTPGRTGNAKLVRCSSCGTWIIESRAITVSGSEAVFCSEECLKR
ncbi:MAG: hypothetical protein ACRD63_13015, partial [Pyrinomonadaceae bacterium]